jgi:hypothetical protein
MRGFAKSVLFFACAGAVFAPAARAGVLALQPSGQTYQGVSIAQAATVAVQGRKTPVATVGYGLRTKYKLFKHWPVYVGQLFASDLPHFARTREGALASLAGMGAAAIRLDFKRAVSSGDIHDSFVESLNKNGVDQTQACVRDFLAAVDAGGDSADGAAMTIVGERLGNGTEAVTVEAFSGTATPIVGPSGFLRSIFAIWLGATTDDDLQSFQEQLIRGTP